MSEEIQNQEPKKKNLPENLEQVDYKDYQAQREKEIDLHAKKKKQKALISKILIGVGILFAAICFSFMGFMAFLIATPVK